MQLDKKDLKILGILKTKADLTTSQISNKTSIPITTIHNRIKKLKKLGIIKNYTINIDYEKIGKNLKAHILITLNQSSLSQHQIGEKLMSLENINSVDIVTGTTDIIAEVRIENMHELNDLITNKIRKVQGIDKTQTLMVLEEIN